MNLYFSHYDASSGLLYSYDELNRRIVPSKVRYANASRYTFETGLQNRVGELIPHIEFQQQFVMAFFEAYNEIQKAHGNLQFDANRLVGFKGQGFIEGDMTFFVERADNPFNVSYREEFRASGYAVHFDGTSLSLVSVIKAALRKLAEKV